MNRPPLLDRFSGFAPRIADWLHGRHYDLAIVEHFWCAPYAAVLRPHATRLIIDLHNIESELHRTSAEHAAAPLAAVHRRFADAYARLEREWLPQYDDVLVTSAADASRIQAPRVAVFPNTIPYHDQPHSTRDHAIVFTGNLEYAPNISAVQWFAREIWPVIRSHDPILEWRLVGRNAHAVEAYIARVPGARIIGPVDDAVAEIARAKLAVVPLRSGSGTRFKILEAWAAATPVVSTSLGAEGLETNNGEHLIIADGAQPFVDAVLRILRDPGDTGRNGRALYLDRYTTEAGWKALTRIGL